MALPLPHVFFGYPVDLYAEPDAGLKLDVAGSIKYVIAQGVNKPYIAEVVGTDPVYNYRRDFIGQSIFGQSKFTFRALKKPMLLDIRAHERGYYVLRHDGPSFALERISTYVLQELLSAKLLGEMDPFTKAAESTLKAKQTLVSYGPVDQALGLALPTVDLTKPIGVEKAAAAAQTALAKLAKMDGISEVERTAAREAIETWLTQQLDVAAATLHKNWGEVGKDLTPPWGNDDTIFYDADDYEDQPKPTRKKKPAPKKAIPLMPVLGKRRINLKDLKG